MKATILLFVLVIAAALGVEDEETKAFNEHIKKFKLSVNPKEFKERAKIFGEKKKEIEAHNKGKSSFKMAVNEFSHLTDKELKNFLGSVEDSATDKNVAPITEAVSVQSVGAVSDIFDWRNTAGVVRPIQNQGNCGSCYAFAGIGAIEGQMALKKLKYEKLSEMEIVQCARDANNVVRRCNGGSDSVVYNHAMYGKGVTAAIYNPYNILLAGNNCDITKPRIFGSAVVNSVSNKLVVAGEAAMMAKLAGGPLYSRYYLAKSFYSYSSGIYDDKLFECQNFSQNHAVLLVGYGTENGIKYWTFKNSWGTGFGEGGYFRMKRGVNLCNIEKYASQPILA